MARITRFAIENTTAQYILGVVIWVTICAMYLMEKTVPDALLIAGSTVLGFYFHNLAQKQTTLKEGQNVGIKKAK